MANHAAHGEFIKRYNAEYNSEEEYIAHKNRVKASIASKRYGGLKPGLLPIEKVKGSKEGKDKGNAR